MQDVQIQAMIALIFPVALQLAKRSQSKALAWIDQNRPKISVAVSGLAAVATNAGLSFAHTSHSVTLTWTDLPSAIHGLVTFGITTALQLFGQHLSYQAIWKHVLPATPNLPATK